MLQNVNDPALLVDCVVRTAALGEKRYAETRNEQYNIFISLPPRNLLRTATEQILSVTVTVSEPESPSESRTVTVTGISGDISKSESRSR